MNLSETASPQPRQRFRTVTETEDEAPLTRDDPADQADRSAALSMLMLGLKSLSQRTIVALSTLFTLLTAISVFVLAYVISDHPTTPQLIELGLYSSFVLCLDFVRRR